MAELTHQCCTPAAQQTCCELSEKASCCGETHAEGCGCAAGATTSPTRSDAASVELVRETYAAAARGRRGRRGMLQPGR